jgi:predicted dehydrogenase
MDAARDHPERIVVVGTQFVLTPSTIEARRQVESGVIGKPVWSQTSYCRNSKDGEWLYYAIDPAWQPGVNLDWNAWCGPMPKDPWNPEVYARWRRYRKWSTGIIGDLLVHKITPLVHAIGLGWPVRVTAAGGHYVDKRMENHDQVNITVEFENEHTMVVAGSTANQEGLPTVIRGHKANLFLEGRRTRLQPEQLFANELEERTFDGEDHGDDQEALRLRWLDSIRTRQPSVSPVELATKVMVIVELATRSMWEGAAFGFNPANRKVRKL